ncbi:hypothetical protein LSTR_LSTR007173 [Laodelphax striatellus]|uniref:Uncharacterized protein n=1 Tax=Laodelphax striatellus TaxID=195883 RepID=A0A482WXB9_LAOST|nr:hypothetical protein LSTR_LSTR007173 [Laodelphax striatellus]
MDSFVLVSSLPGVSDAVEEEETLTIEDDEVEGVNENHIEEEEKELTKRQETTLPVAFVKLYRIEVLERVARAHHRKQSLDEYPEPSSADSDFSEDGNGDDEHDSEVQKTLLAVEMQCHFAGKVSYCIQF